jgi:hypothetical protein
MDLTPARVKPNNVIDLGNLNHSAIVRLANWAQLVKDGKEPMPRSPFCQWAAKRVTDEDKQDLTIFISARKGMGKSYTALGLADRISEEIALVKGGSPRDYFTIDNCALLMDSSKITKLLSTKGNHQVLIIDDAGVGANNREFLSKGNINFNKIMMTCRTKRWVVIFTSVLKSHVDLNIREMSDVLINIYKSFHVGGFNICKAKSSTVVELVNNKNVTMSRHLTMNGDKVSMWVAFGPSPEMAEEYDRQRNIAADNVLKESTEALEKKEKASPETKMQEYIDKYLDTVKTMIECGDSERAVIKKCPGLTPTYLSKLRAHGGF